jgi:methyl-accepting chemotaxis protein
MSKPSSQLTIANRLSVAFGTVVFILLAVGGVSLFTSVKLKEADRWNDHTHKVLGTATRMLEGMLNMETGARGFIIAGKEGFLEPWKAGRGGFDKAWAEAKELTADNAEQQKRLDGMKAREQEFESIVGTLLELRRSTDGVQISMDNIVQTFSLGQDKATMDGFRALHAEFSSAEQSLLLERQQRAEQLRAVNQAAVLVGAVLAVLAAVGMGMWITRSIMRQLGGEPSEAAEVARQIAAGNLAASVALRPGDNSSLMALMRDMQAALTNTVATVRSNAESVATASQEIAKGNADLSERTEQQAASLEETAATMNELGATVNNNADNARQATQLAQSASHVAQQGGSVVGEVVETMKGINESSRKIEEIISVIDGIAFQTNILALNAAVEAARAGEQGRGFAVVAGEVRSLAQRSADAAKDIKALITASVERVEQGSALVDKAGQTMDEVVASIKRVNDIVGEIASASVEQSSGVAQVGQTVTQMDQMTQQNSALVEQSAAAAQSLQSQAQALVQAVAVFKLSGHGSASAGAPAMLSWQPPARAASKPASTSAARTPAAKARSAPPPAPPAKSAAREPVLADNDEWTSF